MRKNEKLENKVVIITGGAGGIGIPNCDAYTATKGATVQLTKSMAVEYGRYVKEAFDAGRKHGAEGLMVCDWGDGGHHQPWIVALPSLIYASGLVCGKDRSRAELAVEIDRICGAKVGEALLRYGDVWEKTSDMRDLFRAYTDRNAKPVPDEAFVVWREAQSLVRFDGASEWVKDDFKTMDLLFRVIEGFSKSQPLDCDKLESTYRALWIKQNREGGLSRSLGALRKE